MNNVWTIAFKTPCVGLRSTSLPIWQQTISIASIASAARSFSNYSSPPPCPISRACSLWPSPLQLNPRTRRYPHCIRKFSASSRQWSRKPTKSTTPVTKFTLPQKASTQKPSGSGVKNETSSSQVDLSSSDVEQILGPGLSFEKGMEVLQELQKRRVSGSLAETGVTFSDDAEVTRDHAMRGLEWLREKYPVDEETAAAEWAEAEAERLQEEFEKRAEKLGLYKRGESVEEDVPSQPQQVTNVFGNSVLVQRRQQAEAEEKARQEAEEKEQKDQPPQPYKGHGLIVSKQVELDTAKQRRHEHWKRLEAAAQLDANQILANRSAFSRLWAPTLFALLVVCTSLVLAESYEPPTHSMRLWPDIPPAVSTCIALTTLNAIVFVVWKRPEAWRTMNRYFLLSAGHPNAFSVLGSVFSHQFFGHLFRNSLFLFLVGIPVHEEVGRGAFLALYLTSGVAGSLASLWTRVLGKSFLAASLGSSSAVYGLVGAYFTLQDSRKISFGKSKDDESQDYSLNYDARIALFFVFLYEFVQWRRFGRVVDGKDGAMDHLTHLGGLAAGAAMGYWLRLRADGRDPVGKILDYRRGPRGGARVGYSSEKGAK